MPRLRPAPVRSEEPEAPVREIIPHPDEINRPELKPVETKGGEKPPVVEKVEPEQQDESALALKKQLDELRRSEELQRTAAERFKREREDALKQVNERVEQAAKYERELQESQELAINNALTAAKTTAEKAEADIMAAEESGDVKAKVDAYRRLARAESDVAKLESGKEELEQRKKILAEQIKTAPPQQPQYPAIAVKWMEDHPEFSGNNSENTRLQWAFRKSCEEGHEAYTKPQIARMEEILGLKKSKEEKEKEVIEESGEGDDGEKSAIFSAPVSRQAPSSSGTRTPSKITLTKDQKEAAAMAGISEVEYAKQLLTLRQMKADGLYGESR